MWCCRFLQPFFQSFPGGQGAHGFHFIIDQEGRGAKDPQRRDFFHIPDMLHLRREAHLPQHRHDGLLQQVARRTAGTENLDAQPASRLFHLLAQGLLELTQEGFLVFLLGGGGDVIPRLDLRQESLGDLEIGASPPGFQIFDGRFQAGDADPEFAEGDLGKVLVGHGL